VSDGSGHKLGEVLRAAREAKGVDLPRVERDTKIRVRYLAALEQAEYRDLPGAVYIKGFLRNYGLYLGLDPEYLIDLYRLELGTAALDRPSLQAPPRPMAVRRTRTLVVTPGALIAAILTVGVAAFIVYFVFELATYAGTPELTITQPLGNVAAYQELTYTIRGRTAPRATVTVSGLTENPSVVADADGNFAVTVRLVPGSNVLSLVARDPVNGRSSDRRDRSIIVVAASPSPGPARVLTVNAPVDRATSGLAVAIRGLGLPGSRVTVTPRLATAAPPGFSVADATGQPVTVSAPAPGPLLLGVGSQGTFSGTLPLSPGSWQLSISAPGTPVVVRSVRVRAPAGLIGSLAVDGGASYIEIEQDGQPLAASGTVVDPGKVVALAAKQTIRIRAGNAGAVMLTINGLKLGAMGTAGAVVEWRITLSATTG